MTPDVTRAQPAAAATPGARARTTAALAPAVVSVAGLLAVFVGVAAGAAWAQAALLAVAVTLVAGVASAGLLSATSGTSVAWPLAFVAAQAVRNGLMIALGFGVYFIARPEPVVAFVAAGLVVALAALLAETALAYCAAGVRPSAAAHPDPLSDGADAA